MRWRHFPVALQHKKPAATFKVAAGHIMARYKNYLSVKTKTEHYLSGRAGFFRAETTAAARVRGVDFTQVRSLSYICVKSGSLPCAGIDQTRAIISP
jgi:hypothetical protein